MQDDKLKRANEIKARIKEIETQEGYIGNITGNGVASGSQGLNSDKYLDTGIQVRFKLGSWEPPRIHFTQAEAGLILMAKLNILGAEKLKLQKEYENL